MDTATDTPLPPGTALRHADDAAALRACWPVARQLRPQLAGIDDFLERVQRMRQHSYRVLAAWHGERVLALAGYRLQENLVYGRFLYIDDLVSSEEVRGQGWGARLIAATRALAAQAGCAHVVLDTAIANTAAQRFYAAQGLANKATRFSCAVPAEVAA
ncbi:N-acetyltransferase GCN5 [Pseudorhodoferax aquiterrae]|uniref:N-acetyltransferase GCN5 n=1 Tax=Pseudorhodoferax aquiterrae TaxID=747304 RepID=A0ABQ3G8N3_9BURK|nr:GNAT family N-acetyltransferase [Pseudorhodoferax aquiterrae]GHC95346.1 N-acetyltransferase GCN5 [Pseudorhodoferax aquiterrae]